MAQNGYCDSSLKTPLHGVIKKTKIVSQHRDVFTEDDLKLLFNNDYYFRNKHRKASQYWIPLLGLFTGARVNELICFLNQAANRPIIFDDEQSKEMLKRIMV
jgi:hypothetical protein